MKHSTVYSGGNEALKADAKSTLTHNNVCKMQLSAPFQTWPWVDNNVVKESLLVGIGNEEGMHVDLASCQKVEPRINPEWRSSIEKSMSHEDFSLKVLVLEL